MTEQNDSPGSVAVTIFGRTYHLRGDGDTSHLEQLAEIVDAKMSEIAEATGTADTLKVAILASLNLADDYMKASGGKLPDTADTDQRLANLVTRLDEVLVASGASTC